MPYGYRCVDYNYLHIFGVGLIMDTKLIPCGAYRHCPITLERQSVYALMITRITDIKAYFGKYKYTVDYVRNELITKWIIPPDVHNGYCFICEPGLLYLKISKVEYEKLLSKDFNLYKRNGYHLTIDWVMNRGIIINPYTP